MIKEKTVSAIMLCIVFLTLTSLGGGKNEEEKEKPSIEGIVANVPTLKYPFPKNWHSTLYWWSVALSYNDPERLKQELNELKSRGLLPVMALKAEYWIKPEEIDKTIAKCHAIAAAGFPVEIQMIGVLNAYLLPDRKLVRHPDAPEKDKKDAVGGRIPCLVMKDGWKARADHIRKLMKKFKTAEVPIAAVWYDYEGHPHPWNGIFEANGNCPACRKQCPPGVLDDRARFMAWVFDLRAQTLSEAFAKPVKEVFPDAKVGFYGYKVSSKEHPVVSSIGVCLPPSKTNPKEIDVSMPVCYAQYQIAKRFFNSDWPISAEALDVIYFTCMLREMSNAQPNLRKDQELIPFVSSLQAYKKALDFPRVSSQIYEEFLRHAIMRGARGFYCFNAAPPYSSLPNYYFELAKINNVYNEMFAPSVRGFLEGGTPINHSWPDPKDQNAIVWSGLKKGDEALIRIVTFAPSAVTVGICPFRGKAITLIAPPEGATYVVNASGEARRIINQ